MNFLWNATNILYQILPGPTPSWPPSLLQDLPEDPLMDWLERAPEDLWGQFQSLENIERKHDESGGWLPSLPRSFVLELAATF